jgi:hypothetical protein
MVTPRIDPRREPLPGGQTSQPDTLTRMIEPGWMRASEPRVGRVLSARRLLLCARVAFGLWVAGWLVFITLVGLRASGAVLAGIGFVVSALFALGLLLEAVGRRRAWRELVREAARDDLTASRSRTGARSRTGERARAANE